MNRVECPFCGSLDLDFSFGTKDREGTPVAVCCADCGANGPYVYLQDLAEFDKAIKKWNTRDYTRIRYG